MRLKFFSVAVVSVWGAAILAAQTPVASQTPPASAPSAWEKAIATPTESDVYCAGFFTHRVLEPDLFVLGGPDGVLKYEYASGDFVYLNRGRNLINAPGGQYMIVRPLKDLNQYETFTGQRKVVAALGTLYSEIARIQIQILNEASATAEILNSCEPVQAGDIAIPLNIRPLPPYKTVKFTERFSPASGKTTGLVAALQRFGVATGANEIVYLNLGSKQGAQVGGYMRIFRSYLNQQDDPALKGTIEFPTDIMGITEGHKLTRKEKESVPRAVVGELIILSVEEGSSTGMITYSLEDVYPGDSVEIE